MAYAKTSQRREKRELREKMRGLGLGYRDIAAEFARRYSLRPRAAWREAYGWSQQEAADRVNDFRGQVGLDPGGFAGMTGPHLCEHENWPGYGPEPSGRRPTPYLLAVLAGVYDCTITDLIDLADREHLPPADLLILDKYVDRRPSTHEGQGTGIRSLIAVGVAAEAVEARVQPTGAEQPRVISSSLPGNAVTAAVGWTHVRDAVMAVADESAGYAAADLGRRVPQASVEQVRSEVVGLARRYTSVPLLDFLAEIRQVRDQAYRLTRRTCRPGQLADLQVAVGAACGLMAVASFNLAAWAAAIEQADAAFVYAEMAGHRGLQAWAAGFQGLVAFWNGRPEEAIRAIGSGLDVAPEGTARVRLHCISARAWAHLGAREQARGALAAADRERDRTGESGTEELHDGIAGEFGWGPARQAMCSASALLIAGDPADAAVRAREAITLHAADHALGDLVGAKAQADLACAELSRGGLDAAGDALSPVWGIAPGFRSYSLVGRLESASIALGAQQYAGSRTATDLAERIRVFSAESAPALAARGILPPGGQ